MESVIRSSMSFNNLTENDIAVTFLKIVNWLESGYSEPMLYPDVECMIKAALYIDGCSQLKEKVTNTIAENYPYHLLLHQEFLKKLDNSNCITYVIRKILTLPKGYKNVYAIDNILKSHNFKSKLIDKSYIYSKYNDKPCVQPNYEKMKLMVNRLFNMAHDDIIIAIRRMLSTVSFSVIGYIFFETPTSSDFYKCNILEQKICEQIESLTIHSYFIESMFLTASTSLKGIKFYWRCLEGKSFAQSLITFFIANLNNFNSSNKKESNYKLLHVMYLLSSALSQSSPCRLQLISEINRNPLIPKDTIAKHFFIYN